MKTSTDSGKAEKRPRKENGQSTSTGGVSPEAASAIATGVGIGLGLGLGAGRMGGDRGMMRDR